MKTTLKSLCAVAFAVLLFGGGLAVGWRWRERSPVVAPITTEMTLDAKNRPATLKQFVVMPDGQRLQHGQQFQWDWQDKPSGCSVFGLRVRREHFDAGRKNGFAAWNDPSYTPDKPIDAAVLTQYPSER